MKDQQKQYQNAKICHICQVRELCYYTEEYRHAHIVYLKYT